jgi:hypothetical protein
VAFFVGIEGNIFLGGRGRVLGAFSLLPLDETETILCSVNLLLYKR